MSTLTLSAPERRALAEFRTMLMTPHQMLCFSGPGLERHGRALETLAERKLLAREKHPGAFSLTSAGYNAMRQEG